MTEPMLGHFISNKVIGGFLTNDDHTVVIYVRIPDWITTIDNSSKSVIKQCIKEIKQQAQAKNLSSDDTDLAEIYVWNTIKSKETLPQFVISKNISSQSSESSGSGNLGLIPDVFSPEFIEKDTDTESLSQTDEFPALAQVNTVNTKQKLKPKMKKIIPTQKLIHVTHDPPSSPEPQRAHIFDQPLPAQPNTHPDPYVNPLDIET